MGQRPVEEPRQSSVLFSLQELMSLEKVRVEEEREALQRDSDARERARREREAQEAAAHEAEWRARAAEEAEHDRRAREEATRLDALRLAAVERARIEVLHAARATETKLANEHQERLVALGRDAEKRKLRRGLIVLSVVSVAALGAALGVYFGKIRPEGAERQAQIEAEAQHARSESERLAQANREAQARIDALAHERDNIANAIPSVPVATATSAPTIKPPQITVTPTATAKPVCNPLDHDPLNGCI